MHAVSCISSFFQICNDSQSFRSEDEVVFRQNFHDISSRDEQVHHFLFLYLLTNLHLAGSWS